jgi:hypothetical protein
MATIDTLELTSVLDAGSGFPIGMRTHERPPRFLGAPFILAQDWTNSNAITGTLAETAVNKQVLIPGGIIGPNGSLRVHAAFQGSNNANIKTCQIKLGGVTISGSTLQFTASPGLAVTRNFANRGAMNLNRWVGSSSSPVAEGTHSVVDTTIDTSIDQLLTFSVTLANIADSVYLAGYRVEVFASE